MERCIGEAIYPHVLQHNRGEIIDEQLHNQLARVAVLPTAEKLVCSYYISLGQKSIILVCDEYSIDSSILLLVQMSQTCQMLRY